MRTPAGLLHSAIADTPSPAASLPLLLHAHAEEQQQQQAISVDSNTVVILASLLCALICVAGLALVARCACRRGGGGASVSLVASSGGNSSGGRSSAQPPRGLEKAAIEALPTVSVSSLKGRRTDVDKEKCAICPATFMEGDQLRVLPRCAHGFHSTCRTPRQHQSLLLLRACFHLGRSMERACHPNRSTDGKYGQGVEKQR